MYAGDDGDSTGSECGRMYTEGTLLRWPGIGERYPGRLRISGGATVVVVVVKYWVTYVRFGSKPFGELFGSTRVPPEAGFPFVRAMAS